MAINKKIFLELKKNLKESFEKYKKEDLQVFYSIFTEFLFLEIPNVIQILTIITFFNFLFKSIYFIIISAFITYFILTAYLKVKMKYFFINEIKDPLSEFNLKIKSHDFIKKEVKIQIYVINIIFTAILIAVGFLLILK